MELLKEPKLEIKDMTGRVLENGHIVVVRYCWNSYAGVIRNNKLSLYEGAERFKGASPYHDLKSTYTYQILGHVDTNHKDFKQEICDWLKSEDGDCPTKITVYDNLQ